MCSSDLADGNTIQGERTPGELVYRGPNVMMGYATNVEDLQRGDNQNGLLKTGDIAERDVDGFYYICGRIKRFIKLFGNRVNLDEVEKHLQNVGFHAHVAGRDDLVIIFAESPDIAKRSAEEFCKTFRFHHSAVATHVQIGRAHV